MKKNELKLSSRKWNIYIRRRELFTEIITGGLNTLNYAVIIPITT